MIYVKPYTLADGTPSFQARSDQPTLTDGSPDPSWAGYNVPSHEWIFVDAQGAIQVQTLDPAIAETAMLKNKELEAAYDTAEQQPISFTTAANVAKNYQADEQSQRKVYEKLAVYKAVGGVPVGFYWVASDNTQVPFTLADLQGLADTMSAQEWQWFDHLQAKKAAVRTAKAAGDIPGIKAVVW